MKEIIKFRSQEGKHYDMEDGTCRAVFGGDVSHYRDDNDQWQDVDVTPAASATPGFSHKLVKVPFYTDFDTNTGNRRIYLNRKDKTKYIEIGGYSNLQAGLTSINDKRLKLGRSFPNFDINILFTDHGVKLEIVLKQKTVDVRSFTFPFKAVGYTIIDGKVLDGDKVVALMPEGYCKDSSSEPIYGDLIEEYKNETVIITADTTGMTYPVIIDPTLTVQPSNADTTLRCNSGGYQCGNNYGTETEVYAASSWGSNTSRRAVLKFDFTSLPAGATISSGVISLWYAGSLWNGNVFSVYAYRFTNTGWTEGGATWNSDAANYTTTDSVAFPVGSSPDSATITNQVIYAQSNTGKILHVMLRDTTDQSGGYNYGSYWYSREYSTASQRPKLEITYTAVNPPTLTTSAASSVEATTATGNGNITDTGGANATTRGFKYGLSQADTWDRSESGSFGTGAYSLGLTGLSPGTTYWIRAYATNSGGTSYGSWVSFLTKPAAPTGVSASDGAYTDRVNFSWNASTGASGYYVYRDGGYIGSTGSTSYNDYGAGAPTITPGTAAASDGASTAHTSLSISGQSANNGSTHTYYVVAYNATGNSSNSSSDTGYRGVGSLTYQWYVSAGDSDASFSLLSGATSASYNDTTAPAPTITPGAAAASDGSSTAHVALSIAGQSANVGAGRYYYCTLSAAGAANQNTTHDRGYRGVGSLTYQWYVSAGDSDASFSALSGATSASYNDTTAPAPTITPGAASASDGSSTAHVALSIAGQSANVGAGRYYYCTLSAAGAANQNTSHDRGYRGVGSLTYQWYISAGDSDVSFSALSGATSASYNDTAAPAPTITPGAAAASDGSSTAHVALSIAGQSADVGAGRYYYCTLSAAGASNQNTTHDRGYRGVGSLTYQWYVSAGDSDASFSALSGATSASWNDTTAPDTGDGRYYYCTLYATGASNQNTTHDRGFKIASGGLFTFHG